MRFLIVLFLCLPSLLSAQSAATLVADDVSIIGSDQLVADGNIEVFYDGTRLSASRIVFDRASDRLVISGPIFIQSSDGILLTADQASLDPKLQNGILQGARLVLDQQLQLAANQIDRAEGRYSQLYKVAVTSCQVCGTRAPLWQIRAEKVVHDQDAQQLYFTNTQFLIRGVPVFWLPKMRLPDPTLKRATGLLIPQLRNTDQLGIGLKLPYYVTLGDHSDVTFTPYLSDKTKTLEARFRQAFLTGDIEVNAAASQDTLVDGTRYYIFAEGQFDLAGDYQLNFGIEAVSDPAYLLDYGYSEKDRLDSSIGILRVRRFDLTQADFTYYQTLRDDEDNASLPPIVANISYERRFENVAGGALRMVASADTAYRYFNTNGDAGRDVSRLGAQAEWSRTWIAPIGVVTQADAGLRADYYDILDDTDYETTGVRLVPDVGLTLRYPLSATSKGGTQHLVEPTLAVAWSDLHGYTPPNEDSTRSELDQANLLAMSRFAGDDAVETGARAALGVTWTRLGASGVNSTLTFGRVFHDTKQDDFNPSSGLDGYTSDWLVAGQLTTTSGFRVDGRTLFDDDADLTRAAARLGWDNDWIALDAAYIWQAADTTESRPDAVSEFTVDTTVQLNSAWAVNVGSRYDLANDGPARAEAGLQYRNECVTVDLSVARRYTSSTTVDPSTSYGLSVALNGFSAGRSSAGPKAACSQ